MNKKTPAMLMAISAAILCFSMLFSSCMGSGAREAVRLLKGDIDTRIENYFDNSVIQPLPETVAASDGISVIIRLDTDCLYDVYEREGKGASFAEFSVSDRADDVRLKIEEKKAEIIERLDGIGLEYSLGVDYDTVIAGFEIEITAGDFEGMCRTLDTDASAIVSEVYKAAEATVVENDVNVYDTGIFDSSDFPYDGEGVVVAVLDTGLDYYHTAFSTDNFTADRSKLGLTFDEVAAVIGDTVASDKQQGLTASDVYISEKVPFGFDYADGDSDVYPMRNPHGVHVSGIIAGKDDVITGVAPNAQIVSMKIFSDVEDTARASWILAALEDCVVLGVDIINMSIGTSCGFSRETDKEQLSGVYDRIREAGISIVAAASNAFNSTYGSEKNGNLGLTSNPDSGTVGSPATYEGAFCVASISGTKTPYLVYNGTIIYFVEATDRVAEEKNFVNELLGDGKDALTLEYVTIPGAGRSADYTGMDVTGKIVLVSRGSTTFEEKALVAEEKGAAAIIIYNNVSGDIKMNVGDVGIPVCSVSQDDGELLAEAGTGTLIIDKANTAGPFISDYSSWGPTPDLGIKPEITAHGGSIYSSVSGQDYDRISGTSMATPNISGVVALLRQYVKENFPAIENDPGKVTSFVNSLLMSTADILYGQNGLPYAVRKQGAGLANLDSAAKTSAIILAYDKNGEQTDKPKLELGDDPEKKGVYTMTFAVNNFGDKALTYAISAKVLTEGVSETKTNDGKTTVTEEAYELDGAVLTVDQVSGGSITDGKLTVEGGSTARVTVTLTLSEKDREYLDTSFENGMYVEGFIVLDSENEDQPDLSCPYLAFYGDWTVAPMFDIDYFATNKDELDNSIDPEDKTMPDAYATRPVGGISMDYVNYMGSYYFIQDPMAKPIAADRKYISITNQEDGVNSLEYVWAGLLRSAERIEITVTDDATGEVVFSKTETDVRKSYGDGGSIYPANVEIGFSAIEHELKNNTTYTVKLQGYLDYGNGGAGKNLNSTFEFPITVDFSAPAVTDVEFYTEYDRAEEKTRLFAKIAVYDNHYAMGIQVGYVGIENDSYVLHGFDKYVTPVYSEFNSTSYIIYELTDHVDTIRENAANRNTFTVACYDYALNEATYEIELPDEYLDFTFAEEEMTLCPNQTFDLSLLVYPESNWPELLEYYSTNDQVATVTGNTVVAVAPGKTRIIARDPETKKTAQLMLTVIGEEDEGYIKYDKPVLEDFVLTGYITEKAYYFLDADDREIGITGDRCIFASQNSYSLSMYPSESVTLEYILRAYFPGDTEVVFETSNDKIVSVSETGTVVANEEGYASITLKVLLDGESTYYSKSVSVEVKDPYETTATTLSHYFGNGGVVRIPETLAVTEIGQFAFSNFEYVAKEPWEEISDENPGSTKPWFIGDVTIEEIIIPEGVEKIGAYAFANLTALKKVVLPSTLINIDQGAFYGCTALKTVEGLENVKFINRDAFAYCGLDGTLEFGKSIALADYAFAYNTKLDGLVLSETTRSVSGYAFAGCSSLKTVTVNADKLKLGIGVFKDCEALESITINAPVIPESTFDGCEALTSVTLGKDVSVIGIYAFRDTGISEFNIDDKNTSFVSGTGLLEIISRDGKTLVAVAPAVKGEYTVPSGISVIGQGAFAGMNDITAVKAPSVTKVEEYAFADARRLASVALGKVESIGDCAFRGSAVTETVKLDGVTLGEYAYAATKITSVTVPDGCKVPKGAFAECKELKSVTVGKNAVLGEYAFGMDSMTNWEIGSYKENGKNIYYYIYTSPLTSLTVGDGTDIGNKAFYGASRLEKVSLGKGIRIGDMAFYNASSLVEIDLSRVISIGEYAFSGDVLQEALDNGFTTLYTDENGDYVYRYYAAPLRVADVSGAEKLGNDAFSYSTSLESIILSPSITEIPDRFALGCVSLKEIDLSGVKIIGINAFEQTALTHAQLDKAEKIGKYAFAQCDRLEKAVFGTACTVEEGAFSYCTSLSVTEGEEKLLYVGDYAFAYTGLTEAMLQGAEYIGEHAYMKEELTPFKAEIGACLKDMGDNPFAMCTLEPFTAYETVEFNGNEYKIPTNTYSVSDTVRVIDGSVYVTSPKGLVLVVGAPSADKVTVEAGTVRIGARAFAGTDITSVVLPAELKSIGHMAFYSCERLSSVAFTSYKAPVLEEEYDLAYFVSGEALPGTGLFYSYTADGSYEEVEGKEILPFFMWNSTESPDVAFYGASFVDRIGHFEPSLVMICPSNGQNYNSFVFNCYFTSSVAGAAAPDSVTAEAIGKIDALPETVTLEDKSAVQEAREAYDKISTMLQKALVTNYDKLTSAEKRIADLEYLAGQTGTDPGTEPGIKEPIPESVRLIAVSIALVLVAAIVAAAVSGLYGRRKSSKKAEN